MNAVLREFRLAARGLRRRRGFALAWIANFSLGICGFAIVFSVVAQTLLRPLPYPGSDRLVSAFQVMPELRDRMPALWNSFGFSYDALRSLQHDVPAFEAVAAFAGGSRAASMVPGAPLERVELLRVSTTAFTLLGVQPVHGRVFLRDEDARPGAPVAVISHGLWQGRFGSRGDILDQSITLDGVAHRIVGILPRGFRLPRANTPPIWIPIGSDPDDDLPQKTPLSVVARLRPGADLEMATMQVATVLKSLSPGQNVEARIATWQSEATRRTRLPLLFLLGASVTLLAVASVSVSGLFAIEVRSRLREFATRVAIGAARRHILRLLCAEALLLAAAAVVVGSWFGVLSLASLRRMSVQILPQLEHAHVDAMVIGVAALVTVTVSLSLAVALSIGVTSHAPAGLLSSTMPGSRRAGRSMTSYALVGVQFGLASFLLIGASLLAVNLARMSAVDAGFDPVDRFVVSVDAGRDARDAATAIPLFTEVANRLRRLPRVRDVAVASAIPFSGGNSSGAMTVEYGAVTDTITARFSSVLPGFIETLGLRVLAGRSIDVDDRVGGTPVVLVNETLARRYWSVRSAIGHGLSIGDTRFTIVGVVSDVRHSSLADSTLPTAYIGEQQKHSRFLQFLIRLDCSGLSASRCAKAVSMSALRQEVAAVAPGIVVNAVESMSALVARSFAGDRDRTMVVALFATLAVVLTVFGAYGTTTRAIQLAKTDIAIRVALGAQRTTTIGAFALRLGGVALLGSLTGAGVALSASNGVRPFLFFVSAADPVVYLSSIACLTATAMVTAAVAAHAIARIDPASVLRAA